MNDRERQFRDLCVAWNAARMERDNCEQQARNFKAKAETADSDLMSLTRELAPFVGPNYPRKLAVIDEKAAVMVSHAEGKPPHVTKVDVVMPDRAAR